MQDAAIVDFRVQNLNLEATENANLYYVLLKGDYKEATLCHAQTGQEWPIKLSS